MELNDKTLDIDIPTIISKSKRVRRNKKALKIINTAFKDLEEYHGMTVGAFFKRECTYKHPSLGSFKLKGAYIKSPVSSFENIVKIFTDKNTDRRFCLGTWYHPHSKNSSFRDTLEVRYNSLLQMRKDTSVGFIKDNKQLKALSESDIRRYSLLYISDLPYYSTYIDPNNYFSCFLFPTDDEKTAYFFETGYEWCFDISFFLNLLHLLKIYIEGSNKELVECVREKKGLPKLENPFYRQDYLEDIYKKQIDNLLNT